MANKNYNGSPKRMAAPKPPSEPKGVRTSDLEFNVNAQSHWPGAPGPKGPGWGRSMQGFREVKAGAEQDMPNDFNLSGAFSGAMTGASTGAMVGGPWGAVIGGVAGFAMGAFTKKPEDEQQQKPEVNEV
jgi:hypothetical protein